MRLLTIAGLALALTACSAASAPPQRGTPAPAASPAPDMPVHQAPIDAAAPEGVTASAGGVVLTAERAFAAAELGYTVAANGVARLVDAGFITGDTATRVRGWNAAARRLLVAGKATADAAEKARVAADLFGITDRLNALLGAR